MEEKFIAKENTEILTKVSVIVDREKYIIESAYSDSDTLDLLSKCIESYCFSHNYKKKDIVTAMEQVLKNEPICCNYFTNNITVNVMIEQYNHRCITIKECNPYNIIRTLIDCFISTNIQTTWHQYSILKWMQEYVDEYKSSTTIEEDIDEIEELNHEND